MSATPDTAALVRRARRDRWSRAAGRSYPVDIRWRPIERRARIEEAVAGAVRSALRDDAGDVLVFLPGIGEIRRVEASLQGTLASDVDVLPLAGALSLAEQDRALAAVAAGAATRRAVDRHRRDVADRRRRARRRRLRPRSGTALRHADRHDPADDDHHEPGVGRPACRTGRPPRARERATGCGARSSTARGRPTGRPRSRRSTSPGSCSSSPPGAPTSTGWRS